MSSDAIRQYWPKFDELITKAESPETKLLIEAIKLQTEVLNLRLNAIEHLSGAQMRADVRKSSYPNPR